MLDDATHTKCSIKCLAENKKKVPSVQEELESSEANLFKGVCIADMNQGPSNQIKPVTSLHKILKFRLLSEADEQDLTGKLPDSPSREENLCEN